jgi:hypothetical protein
LKGAFHGVGTSIAALVSITIPRPGEAGLTLAESINPNYIKWLKTLFVFKTTIE